ncbi:quinon protein alcohol dehydrogenase-like superfamily [Chytridium lagenaria]|nr:quinon protein alcohol dehydrogenase-like superfamily [Chytridium lagenaria]
MAALDFKNLQLESIIGFGGSVPQGLVKHPNGVHIVYSLGSTVVIHGHEEAKTVKSFCKGTPTSSAADIIIWDFEKRILLRRLTLHKVKVQALAFSPNDKYLASLGAEDDNSVIVWDLEKGAAICGSPASKDSSGVTLSLAYLNKDDNLNAVQRKVRATDCQTGQIKRIVKCITVDSDDEFMYCGTTTGDLLQVNLRTKLFKHSGPPKEKDLFSMGILSVALSPSNDMVIAGHFFAGTSYSNIYYIGVNDFTANLKSTCHYAPINDICFPTDSSDVFATASDADIRVWNANSCSELLRISVPNLECKCITFKKDGSSLVSGWNDGKIRAFGPQSGRLQYEINDAHKRGVTALSVTDPFNQRGDFRIVSGGEGESVEGIKARSSTGRRHEGAQGNRHMYQNSKEQPRMCFLKFRWILCYLGLDALRAQPSSLRTIILQSRVLLPRWSQLLTSGTDRKVAYWEAFDGSLIRELEASQSDTINGLDITTNGKYFVIGGSDKLVKIYRYEEGDVAFIGIGHSTDIMKVKISPDQRHVVSVSADGAIFRWSFP